MGPVRLGVGTEWLLDGRAFRVVRQLAADRFIAQDVKFLVEQEFSQDEILAHYSAGRLRFATPEGAAEARKPRRARRTVQDLEARQKRILERRWQALEPLTKLGGRPLESPLQRARGRTSSEGNPLLSADPAALLSALGLGWAGPPGPGPSRAATAAPSREASPP